MSTSRVVLFLLATLLAAGCVSNPPAPVAKVPMEFEPAIKKLADNLFAQIKAGRGLLAGKTVFVIDPFIDANTAEVNEMSQQIEQIMVRELRSAFPEFRVEAMTPQTLATATHVINGSTRVDRSTPERFYRVSSSVVDAKTGVVAANAEVWVLNQQLKHAPVSSYRDSPMYLKDKRVEGYIATTLTPAGELADREYFDSLPTAALLAEADKAFEESDYKRALAIYQLAESRQDGKIMKTYSALYQCHRKLGRAAEAEEAFIRLVDLGLANMNISTRFLFSVKSTEFIADNDLRSQYALWLKHIAKRTAAAGVCLQILGHSSRSGTEKYNENLSLQRAQSVQKIVQKDFVGAGQKTKAIGRGYRDNIIGSGSDDTQDAIDRRVEFRVTDCSRLQVESR